MCWLLECSGCNWQHLCVHLGCRAVSGSIKPILSCLSPPTLLGLYSSSSSSPSPSIFSVPSVLFSLHPALSQLNCQSKSPWWPTAEVRTKEQKPTGLCIKTERTQSKWVGEWNNGGEGNKDKEKQCFRISEESPAQLFQTCILCGCPISLPFLHLLWSLGLLSEKIDEQRKWQSQKLKKKSYKVCVAHLLLSFNTVRP